MPLESDRDILIELRTKVTEIHRDMTQPEGRVPKLESKVEEHSAQINKARGSIGALIWILGGVGVLIAGLATALFAHMLGGGK